VIRLAITLLSVVTDAHFHTEIIITNEDVEGLPILMLANKQDREDRLEVEDIKEIFNKIAVRMSARDSRVLPISALSGYV
jgi:ADP-ribosylation factor related protein 1